jgi:hypothetical protein
MQYIYRAALAVNSGVRGSCRQTQVLQNACHRAKWATACRYVGLVAAVLGENTMPCILYRYHINTSIKCALRYNIVCSFYAFVM